MYKLILVILAVAAAAYADTTVVKSAVVPSMPAAYMPGYAAYNSYPYYQYQSGYQYPGYQNMYSPMAYAPLSAGYMPYAYGQQYIYTKPMAASPAATYVA